MIDLGCKVQSPQRDAEQKPQPGHDAVTVADAHARLGQVQLEQADVLERGRLRGPLQKRSKSLAAADVTPLRPAQSLRAFMSPAFATPSRGQALDHALAQRR